MNFKLCDLRRLVLFLMAALFITTLGGVAMADDEAVPAAQNYDASPSAPFESSDSNQAPAYEENASPDGSMSSGAVSSPGNVTVDFKEADIRNVLRILSFKSGVNIIAGNDVTGSVTIRLVDVPWEKALDVVLKTYGYAYDRDDNIIRVTTLENLKREELSTEVFTLNYSQASEVEKSLKDMLSDRGKIRSDGRSNTVIVTDMPTILQSVRKVVERLDTITPQVLIEAKVIETTLGDTDKMGINWNLSAAITGSMRPHTFPFPAIAPVDSSILRSALPQGRGATTATVTSGAGGTTTTNDFPTGVPQAFQATYPVADKADFKFGTLDFSQLRMVLDFINQRGDAKVLSEPHVTTLDNQEAKVLVGEVLAVPTFERNTTTGRLEITGYHDRDIGIRLTVTPQVNDQSEIVVNIHPQIINLLGYDELTSEIKVPRFSTREAHTRVRIKSGQTIAIGGLIKENVVDTKTKVPILGDIPLLNLFFRHTDRQTTKTDLLFFMTVTVVSDKALPQGHKL